MTRLTDGFDFLGFHFRNSKGNHINIPGSSGTKSGYKLIIKAWPLSITSIKARLKEKFVKLRSSPRGQLIREGNRLIRDWTNSHRANCASETFNALSAYLFELQGRYGGRRHLNKEDMENLKGLRRI